MAEKEVIAWYTKGGKHIPIFADNESDYAEDKKNREIAENKRQADKLNKKEQSIESVLFDIEKEIKDKNTETFIVFDKNGKEILHKDGSEKTVELIDNDRASLKDAIGTHNHPSGSRFSDSDIAVFVNQDMQELRVITKDNRICVIKKISDNPNKDLYKDYFAIPVNFHDDYKKFVDDKVKKDKIDEDDESLGWAFWDRYTENCRREYSANWLKKNANKYGYAYNEYMLGKD